MNRNSFLLSGFRDFNPNQMINRKYIFKNIENIFIKYGFLPIETPVLEKFSLFSNIYGSENEKLIFNVINSGNFLSTINVSDFYKGYKHLLSLISFKAMRYDLTFPFYRYMISHENQYFPFKRYQIQPVWRADRPQKGRYREFYQCDADIVGSDSLISESEMLCMINEILTSFGINKFNIYINHRLVLKSISKYIGESLKEYYLYIGIDKIDKIGKYKVFKYFINKGFSYLSLFKLENIFNFKGNNKKKIFFLKKKISNCDYITSALDDILNILKYSSLVFNKKKNIVFDLKLSRGISYYSGAIFEVKLNNINIGSICGGGRYKKLINISNSLNFSGIGFSFGLDRLYFVINKLNLFPKNKFSVMVMIANINLNYACFNILSDLRLKGNSVEIYPDVIDLSKQLIYANKKSIPFVLIINYKSNHLDSFILRNMLTGEQNIYNKKSIINIFS